MERETLQEIGLKHKTDKATFHKYCDFYEKHLPNRNAKIRLLEIGIMHGSSLKTWREYFTNAEIIGIDINVIAEPIEGVTMIEMNSTDITAIKELGMFDVIIEDSSHTTLEQQINFHWLYNNQLNEGGMFVMEDLHTSFMLSYVNSKITTYDLLKDIKGVKKYHGNDNQSITFVIPK